MFFSQHRASHCPYFYFICSVWKAEASEQIGTKSARQSAALNYNAALKQRFANHPEIRRIDRQRHVPKAIYTAKKVKATMELAEVTAWSVLYFFMKGV
jgi:hypothetical protein